MWVRRRLYAWGLFPTYRSPLFVISVGNLAVGGSGKTPVVHKLASALAKKRRVAVLSRGYGSLAEHGKEPLLVEANMAAAVCGDEPLWLKQQLPEIDVWVGKNRIASAKQAEAKGAEILLLDDGMQHLAMARDLEIVVLGENPLFLREGLRSLRYADLIVTRGSQMPQVGVPVVEMKMEIETALRNQRVAVFCAIGNPRQFVRSVQEAGLEVVSTFFKRDHASFSEKELAQFYEKSGAECLVCTEKDAVKLPKSALPIYALHGTLKIVRGEAAWNQMLEEILCQNAIP